MPLFALAMNFGWELVYALYVVETPLEQAVFTIWLILDCGLVYGMVKFGGNDWAHAPVVARNLVPIFALLTSVAAAGNFAFAKWWIEYGVGGFRQGKWYHGVEGVDTTELGFWSSVFAQAFLSATCLAQLVERQHSRGVSWAIWYVFGSFSLLYQLQPPWKEEL
jgi:hypothetical protein